MFWIIVIIVKVLIQNIYIAFYLKWCEERAARGPVRNERRYTGINLNTTRPPLPWSLLSWSSVLLGEMTSSSLISWSDSKIPIISKKNVQMHNHDAQRGVVVVVKHCFTSLFGTNGPLSDIVINKNVVVNWWDEWCTDDNVRVGMIGHGELLRTFSFSRPITGSGMSKRSTLRHAQTAEDLVSMRNLLLKLRGISRSSAILRSDSPQSNNRKGNSIHSPWET